MYVFQLLAYLAYMAYEAHKAFMAFKAYKASSARDSIRSKNTAQQHLLVWIGREQYDLCMRL